MGMEIYILVGIFLLLCKQNSSFDNEILEVIVYLQNSPLMKYSQQMHTSCFHAVHSTASWTRSEGLWKGPVFPFTADW